MVFGCSSDKGDVMPVHIFEQGLREMCEVAEDCGQNLAEKGFWWKAICAAAGFSSAMHLERIISGVWRISRALLVPVSGLLTLLVAIQCMVVVVVARANQNVHQPLYLQLSL